MFALDLVPEGWLMEKIFHSNILVLKLKYFCVWCMKVIYQSPLALWLTAICCTSCDNFEKIFCLMQTRVHQLQAILNKRQSQETVRLREIFRALTNVYTLHLIFNKQINSFQNFLNHNEFDNWPEWELFLPIGQIQNFSLFLHFSEVCCDIFFICHV